MACFFQRGPPETTILLGEGKYGSGSGPQRKTGWTRYPNLYKALLEEPSRIRRRKLLEGKLRGTVSDGRIMGRPARARISKEPVDGRLD